jgi:hypothetical protein
MTQPVYVSIDIEADGPIPGMNSMLSLGAAAFQGSSRTPIDLFEVNLQPLPEAVPDPDTMAWWNKPEQAEALAYVRQNPRAPEIAMKQFRAWLEALHGKPVFVGYPATYDFMFAYWYLVRFTGFPVPFGFSGLDIKTLAAAKLGVAYPHATKRNMPKKWFEGCPPHTHKALDDAIGQGILFLNILKGV